MQLQGWGARRLLPWLSASAGLGYSLWGNVKGDDDALAPSMPLPAPVVPTADPHRQGGHQLDLALGLNTVVTGGPLRGNRFAIEVGRPLYQWLDGPKLETDWQLIAGWQLAF